MKSVFDDSKPIFQQISEMIADDIVDGQLQEGDQLPSTTALSQFYRINRATAQKGLAALVDGGYVYKQRGVGMFVAEGARDKLLAERKLDFYQQYVRPMLEEARRIHLPKKEIIRLIEEDYDD
ncbi:GntR family transcriptional regulator [Shouchella clausii]|uniref:GntR family transcriptional regulator n=1 Tax=Shouchella clausii TaxID=79880 RepID=A0A268RVI1_SHOCL|nr:GntR family transcriptional regulator [Shouchella clausii]PAD41193.1 GntR family transcriptional regulator [Bacillus sp. 7520-S]MBU8598819.1 GntR family transcriptional regulator [Shouchella clausii]MCY1105711.1 GntR family transcriptional regulator [Shouchella clausii]MEB5478340.1 GntR family transcriptional regulator [Shouchella clausii]MED4160446.1 GntR family transcriptional regulator [Shouchella clausii]